MLIQLFTLKKRSLFSTHDPTGLKLLARLRLKFSHLKDHRFCDNFRDYASPMFPCLFLWCWNSCNQVLFFLRCLFFDSKIENLYDNLIHPSNISFDDILGFPNIILISCYIVLINIISYRLHKCFTDQK